MPLPLASDVISPDPAERIRRARHGTNHVLYSRDGSLIATSDVQMNVFVRRGNELVYEGRFESANEKIRSTERVRGLAFSANGKTLWVASGDTLRAIDLTTGVVTWEYTPPRSYGFLIISPMSVAVSDSGQVVATFDNGTIGIWTEEGTEVAKWRENDAPRNIAFVSDGTKLVGADGFYVSQWDPTLPRHRRTAQFRVQERIYGAALHPNLPLVAIRHLSHAELWDTDSQRVVRSFPVDIGLPLIGFHPSRPWLALGSRHAVDVVTFEGESVARYPVEDAAVVSFGISALGGELAVGCSDEVLRRFSLPPWE
jgi:WD40 repeat protein